MKMKKFVFGLLAVVALLAFSAEAYSNADGDQTTEQGIEKRKLTKKI
ncbi:hypothetical protein [Ulvibacterium sp.]|nr:hypothetical protein [Ulvibacterium sp.]